MNIYLENGYLNWKLIRNIGTEIILIVGARGIGKTYGLLELYHDEGIDFMLLRRTQTQLDALMQPKFNPFDDLNSDKEHINVGVKKTTKQTLGFYNMQEVEGIMKCVGTPIGHGAALSTFMNIRGIAGGSFQELFYDEFIPQPNERKIKGEALAFFNTVESINRNREQQGKEPLRVICAANSNDITNPLFMEWGLVKIADKMQKTGQEIYINRDRHLTIIFPQKSPITEEKRKSFLYESMREGSDFTKMALGNEFLNERAGTIKSRNIKEYRPIVIIGEICIYEHKSNNSYYVTTHFSGSPPVYDIGAVELARFKKHYWWVWDEFIDDNMLFQDYVCETLLRKYFDL